MGALGHLLALAGVTMAVETLILAAAGYRTRAFVQVCLLTNLATNVSLNLGLSLLGPPGYWLALGPAEAAVVLIEWTVLRLVPDRADQADQADQTRPWRGPASRRLLGFVFLANLVSAACGPIFFW